MEEHGQIPIWFFIGALLLLYGVVIAASGIYHWSSPPTNIRLSGLHADVWWSGLMILVGLYYSIRFRPRRNA